MALTEQDKNKYIKFVCDFSIERLRKFKDSLNKDYVFLSTAALNASSDASKKHYLSEKTTALDKILIIEKLIKEKKTKCLTQSLIE